MSVSDRRTPDAEPARPFVSYSLNYEDVILNRLFAKQQRGFYVDVGAGHPEYENDLFALYNRGWSGINVEPNERFSELHRQTRPRDQTLCIVLSDAPGEPLTYYQIDGSGLSTCDEMQAKQHAAHGHVLQARSVAVGTLAGILAEAGIQSFDILKVDVEGLEEKVLSGNDWERFRPSVVLVEATFPESQERRPTNIRGYMEQRGYRHVLFDGLNDFYLEHSFQEPPGLSLPPNVFDPFVPREVAELRRQVALLQTSFASAENYALSLKAKQDEVELSAAEIQGEHDRALSAAEALATENRKLQQRLRSQDNDIRRLRGAADQMRAEITVLNRMLEPLHATLEHNRQMSRSHQDRADRLHTQLSDAHANLANVSESLQIVYASRSWKLTKPWRLAGRLLKRLGG